MQLDPEEAETVPPQSMISWVCNPGSATPFPTCKPPRHVRYARVASLLILHRISCTAQPDPMHHGKHMGYVFSCIFAVPLFQRLGSAGWKLSGKMFIAHLQKNHTACTSLTVPALCYSSGCAQGCADAIVSVRGKHSQNHDLSL